MILYKLKSMYDCLPKSISHNMNKSYLKIIQKCSGNLNVVELK